MPLNSHAAKRQVQRQIYPDTSCLRIDSNTLPHKELTLLLLPPELEQRALGILRRCQSVLDDLIGTPNSRFSVVNIRQADYGPTIAIDGNEATLVVGPNAVSCESTLVSNVAHESVHLYLTDGAFGDASGLEEGFALHFELSTVEEHYGKSERQRHIDHLPATYTTALRDYERLLTIEDNPVIRCLERHGKLTGLSWRDMRQLFPQTGWWMSYRLVRRRRMRVG